MTIHSFRFKRFHLDFVRRYRCFGLGLEFYWDFFSERRFSIHFLWWVLAITKEWDGVIPQKKGRL